MPPGGARPNSGPKKGAIYKKTLDKLAAREHVRTVILESLRPMLRAQIANATGIGHVYTRDEHGKFSRIENIKQIDKLLADGIEEDDYWIFAKDPNVSAFTDLMNRALDKPKEQEQDFNISGNIALKWDE